MARSICPWWLGYFLASPVRRLWQNPHAILKSFVQEGMVVLEPGSGMGFFTLELARLVGRNGKVIAVDLQPKMLAGLQRRARNVGLLDRIEVRLAQDDKMGLDDLDGKVDFVLAFAMVHELPDSGRFLGEMHRVLGPRRKFMVAEPRGHVKEADFTALMETAKRAGFRVSGGPAIRASWTAVFERG
jgi:ubiquinone/menaquinone biosynthesis C-methylase UbiE